MNPRRRRHNKRARARRAFSLRYQRWIQTRTAILDRAVQYAREAMVDLLNETVVPELAAKWMPLDTPENWAKVAKIRWEIP